MKKIRINKTVLLTALLAAAALICFASVYYLNSLDLSQSLYGESEETAETENTVYLYEPDYRTDIMTLPEYTQKNLYLTYTNGAESYTLTPDDYSQFGVCVEFFGEYFDALKAGDADKLNTFYTDAYFADNPRFGTITMQKIYDINIEFVSREANDADDFVVYKFYVYYRIMRNDGTFRSDIASDAELPAVYELRYDFENVLIESVVTRN